MLSLFRYLFGGNSSQPESLELQGELYRKREESWHLLLEESKIQLIDNTLFFLKGYDLDTNSIMVRVLLNENCFLCQTQAPATKATAFAWQMLNDEGELESFLFEPKAGSESFFDLFKYSCARSIFAAKTGKKKEEATQAELDEILQNKLNISADDYVGLLENLKISSAEEQRTLPKGASQRAYLGMAHFLQFLAQEKKFVPIEPNPIEVEIFDLDLFSPLLVVKLSSGEIRQPICAEMYAQFFPEKHAMTWIYIVGTFSFTFSLTFDNNNESLFYNVFARKLYESKMKKPFDLSDSEKEYLTNMMSNDQKESSEMEVEADPSTKGEQETDLPQITPTPMFQPAVHIEKDERELLEEEESEEEKEKEKETTKAEKKQQTKTSIRSKAEKKKETNIFDENSLLSVGRHKGLNYVVQGTKIGVFGESDSKTLSKKTVINSISTPGGTKFIPKKMMLHEGDNSLLLLGPENNNAVYKMDLNRGSIVEEWKSKQSVDEIFYQSKYDDTNEQTFGGLNTNNFFMIDPRTPNGIVNRYKYKTNPQLSFGATNAAGQLVLGSSDGGLRFYSNVFEGKKKTVSQARAKTALPGFGDPIKGLEVSADGKWILATCKTYLLLVNTELKNGETAFDQSIPKDERVLPKRLVLKPEHLARMGITLDQVDFTPAKFNEGRKETERSIVSSTGRFLISWNFKKIMRGILDQYQIRAYQQDIAADSFWFDDANRIVVALNKDVVIAKN